MLPVERLLWLAWMRENFQFWGGFLYDVHVGEGIPIDPAWPPNIRAASRSLTQKRIDAIAWRNQVLWIFEVKPDAGLSAVGQLLSYRVLYRKTFGYQDKIQLGIITDQINPDEKYLFDKFNIRIFLVKPSPA